MTNCRSLSFPLFIYLFLAISTHAFPQASGSFTSFEVQGAGAGTLQGTIAKGIDTAGDVAGSYIDANGTSHGFVRTANGTITTFDAPGATTGKKQGTFVTATDTAGDIAGYFTAATENYGFVRASNGTISTFVVSTGGWPGEGTEVLGINSVGAVTGEDQNNEVGYVRSPDGTITSFSGNNSTVGIAINTAGVVAGRYIDNNCISHGFTRAANGTTTTFDPSGVATAHPCANYGDFGTLPTSIDTAGDIAGTYTDVNGARHGFVRTANGTITTFDAPGADTGPCATSGMGVLICGTGGFAMDDAMNIVGVYVDANNVSHGFLRSGASGAFTSFDAPGAGTGSYEGTGAFAINAAGAIAGTYIDANSVLHGFVGTPAPAATTTTLKALQSVSVFNEPANFTATVSSSFGTPPNGESVYFTNGSTQLGSAPLSSGTASFTTTALPVGADSVTASYAGDTSFAGSSSAPVSQPVGKATSFTTLTSSPNPSTAQQQVTLTAAVSGQFGGTATGSVTFSNGATSLGSATLSGNSAAIMTAALPSGTDSITAAYSGDSNFGASTSNSVSQVVNAAADFSVAATPASFTVTAGQSGTTTVTVTPANGFNSAVSFACSGLPTGATCSFSPTTVTPSGAPASTTLSLATSASTASLRRGSSPLFPGSVLAAVLCCFGFRNRRRLQMLLLLTMSVCGFTLLTGCGGASTVGQVQPITSTITVTAASGSLSHTTTFSLTVN
jgi:hypothetical protein